MYHKKLLRRDNFVYYANYVANVLNAAKQVAVISPLCESSRIHKTDDPAHPKRYVIVLETPPLVSPQTVVQAATVQEFREHGEAN